MKPLIISFGESLVDFLPDRAGAPLREVATFRKSVGGAPANVAVGIARLGGAIAMIGKVGDDEFGHFLRDALRAEGVDITGVHTTSAAKTGITFISLSADGDRSFLFFREKSAEQTMCRDDIDTSVIDRATVFIAGSNFFVTEGPRQAAYFALDYARRHDTFIVLDPNVRLHLWSDPEDAREHVRRAMGYADVVKLNEEELSFLRPDDDPAALWDELHPHGLAALIVTRAERGAEVFWPCGHVEIGAPATQVLDTTGAGDGFVAGLVCALTRGVSSVDSRELRRRVRTYEPHDWQRILGLACHVGTQVCRELGATPGLPAAHTIPWAELGFEP